MRYIGKIILVNDVENETTNYINNIESSLLRVFNREIKEEGWNLKNSFDLDSAHAVIKEAYIASEEKKTIILPSYNFNNEAQNALLKILEEPPNNIEFIIITQNKNALLPTVRSRLIIEDKRVKIPRNPFELDLNKMTLGDIADFTEHIKTSVGSNKLESRQIIESLLFEARDMNFSKNELEFFERAIIELENSRMICFSIIAPLLMILQKKKNDIKKT